MFLFAGIFFGFDLISQYFTKVLPQVLSQPGKEIYYNQAFSGFISRLGISGGLLIFFVQLFALIILLVTLFVIFKRKQCKSLGYGLIISATLLISPVSWQHHFVWLLFPYILLCHSVFSTESIMIKHCLSSKYFPLITRPR